MYRHVKEENIFRIRKNEELRNLYEDLVAMIKKGRLCWLAPYVCDEGTKKRAGLEHGNTEGSWRRES